MAAWTHNDTRKWDDKYYQGYRNTVAHRAELFRGRSEDCADLSMKILIEFAAECGLPLTFEDNGGTKYSSRNAGIGGGVFAISIDSVEKYYNLIKQKIGVEALWNHNTVVNMRGPESGDLMMKYAATTHSAGGIEFKEVHAHHAALVIRRHNIGVAHPMEKDSNVPIFPGGKAAEEQHDVTQYYRGTVDPKTGITVSRRADKDVHFDFLNSRSSKKRNAEVIHFANARQLNEDGFLFCKYNKQVLS